jgi:hypothetical protein
MAKEMWAPTQKQAQRGQAASTVKEPKSEFRSSTAPAGQIKDWIVRDGAQNAANHNIRKTDEKLFIVQLFTCAI